MLQKSVSAFGSMCNFGFALAMAPLHMSRQGDLSSRQSPCSQLQSFGSLLRRMIRFASLCALCCRIGLLWSSSLKSAGSKPAAFCMDIFWLAVSCDGLVLVVILVWRHENICDCLDGLNRFIRKYPDSSGTTRKLDALGAKGILVLAWVVVPNSIAASGLFLTDPRNPRYLYSWLPSGAQESKVVFLLSYAMETYLLMLTNFLWNLSFAIFTLYTFAVYEMLHRLKQEALGVSKTSFRALFRRISESEIKRAKSDKIKEAVRRQRRLFKVQGIIAKYREIQIVAGRFQAVIMSSLGVNLVLSLCVYHIFLIYICVKLHDYLPVMMLGTYAFWALNFISIDIFVPVLMGRVSREAGKIVKILAGAVMRRERRFVKLRPISVTLMRMKKLSPLLLLIVVFRISRYLVLMF